VGTGNNFAVTLQPDVLEPAVAVNQPRKIFVNSMSASFPSRRATGIIQSVFDVMGQSSLAYVSDFTKRSERLVEVAGKCHGHDNVWMGVSVEKRGIYYRIEHLRKVPASVRFYRSNRCWVLFLKLPASRNPLVISVESPPWSAQQ